MKWDGYKEFKKYRVVDVNSLEDFCAKYYKHDRFAGRGKEYVDAILEGNRKFLKEDGYTIISHHDSVTGRVVSYYANTK